MIKTLKDLKEYLSKIPDDALDTLGVGVNGESDGDVCLMCDQEDYLEVFEKYPLEELTAWLENIKDAHERYVDQEDLDYWDEEVFITSSRSRKENEDKDE